MTKRTFLVLTVAALGVVLLVAGVYATQQAPETITMESPIFAKHMKALVTLSHKKHAEDYKIPCTDCHHVYKEGKNVWKEGDEVQNCTACHSEAKAPRKQVEVSTGRPVGPQLTKAEKIKQYYYSAIHENCVGCHNDLKKAAKPTGPTHCKDCHPKTR